MLGRLTMAAHSVMTINGASINMKTMRRRRERRGGGGRERERERTNERTNFLLTRVKE